ncbi:unnamed protein product [Orchesella dallaii]|uniref:Uncharacterized protein n=1 Tax=Orchesella dallaii TaxID=48710 RepID=A0ABP1S172_9HEXA
MCMRLNCPNIIVRAAMTRETKSLAAVLSQENTPPPKHQKMMQHKRGHQIVSPSMRMHPDEAYE